MPDVITQDDAQYTFEIVKAICSEVGPGLPGTPQEQKRAEYLKKELASHLGADNVVTEEFAFRPGAFLGAQLISTVFMILAMLLNVSVRSFSGAFLWASVISSGALSIGAILLFVMEFVFCFELVDPFFKEKSSVNVIGTLRKPGTEEVKHLLILSGHHDSALEFTWLRLTGYGFFFLNVTWVIALITVLVMNCIQLAGLVTANDSLVSAGTLGWVPLAYPILPAVIFAVFFTKREKGGGTVPGAADNLSGCALAVTMSRFLAQNPAYIPADTEIRFITFGSEEAGLRGSRRYVSRHLDELKRLDARQINYETIANPEIVILTSEANGTVTNSAQLVKSVITAAQRAGIPYKVAPASLGTSSDAAPFSWAGLKATSLIGFNIRQLVAFYHQENDSPEVLTLEPFINVLKLTLEWIKSGGV